MGRNGLKFAWEHSSTPEHAQYASSGLLPATHFDDRESLDAYVGQGEKHFGGNDFGQIFRQYDESFFTGRSLTVIYVEDAISGVAYDAQGISMASGGSMNIGVRRHSPQTSDPVMTAQFILVEHSKANTAGFSFFGAFCRPLYLFELPDDYGIHQAAADGVYVNANGETLNQAVVDDFYSNASKGLAAFMRV